LKIVIDLIANCGRLVSEMQNNSKNQPRPHGTFPQGILHLTCASGFFYEVIYG